MSETEYLLYLYAESPVHTGAAGSLDVLDLPVQRESSTGYPVIWGQSLKGALRQAAEDIGGAEWPKPRIDTVFGSEIKSGGEDGGSAGTLAVGDAQLVAMPVPTLRETFAWVTSGIALGRLARKYARLKQTCPAVPSVASDGGLCASPDWSLAQQEVLGPLLVQLQNQAAGSLAEWSGRLVADALGGEQGVFETFAKKLRKDLLLLGDDIVPVLLRECTEQAVRVQLKDDSKTVAEGPFYSEYLPAETILAASLTLRGKGNEPEHRKALRGLLDGQLLQVGGDETLGKGLVWARLLPEGTAAA